MNKKFSTLVGCLALGTAFSAVGQVNFPVSDAYTQVTPCATGLTYRSFGTKSASTLGSEVNKIEANKWYQLRVDDEEGEKVLIQERNFKTGEVTLRIVDAKDAPLNYSLWQISFNKSDGQTGGKFTFKNKETGLGIVFDHETAYTIDEFGTNVAELGAGEKISILEGCNAEWSWFSSDEDNNNTLANKVLYAQFHDSNKYLVLKKSMNAAVNPDGLNIPGKQVVSVVYSSADAGEGAESCNALRFTPVETVPILLGAKDINRLIDAQGDKAAGFKFMTPTGIGNRTAMNPEDNSTLDTYKYKAVEDNSIAETLEAWANNIDKAFASNAEDAVRLANENYSYWAGMHSNANWNVENADAKTREAVLEAKSAFDAAETNIEKIQTANALLNAIQAAYTANEDWKTALETDSEWDGQSYSDRIAASTKKVQGFVDAIPEDQSSLAEQYKKEAAIARQFPIRLLAQTETDETKNNKYLMVDTVRWEETSEMPSNSPELLLSNKVPNPDASLYINARYNYRLTYFPTQDSLVIEPLNASVQSDAEYAAKTKWKDSYLASNFIYSNDLDDRAERVSNTEMVASGKPEQAPVVVMLSKLNTENDWVLTTGATDKISGYPGSLHTCIEFDHSYPTLTRTTVDQAVYNIQLLTNKPANLTTHRVNGAYIVADMGGHVVYDEKERSQEFTHMPATQWVVEYTGCEDDPVARVKVVNREYATVAFEGQLYKAGEDSIFIINHNYNVELDGHVANDTLFACSDTLKFIKIDPANTLGYLTPGDQVIENTFKLRQFFDYGEDPYYLNAVKQGTDTLLRAQTEGSDFELVPARVEKDNVIYHIPEEIAYGYTSEAAGAPQLYKSIYNLKVKDADNINNDHLFVGINSNGKYCVADTLDQKADYTLAYFALKENNDLEGAHYYALVRVGIEIDAERDDNDNITSWDYTISDLDKLAIEQGQLDAKVERLCESRTEAFTLEADTMPYYRRVVGLKNEKFYSTNNENRTLGESVINGVSYMNIFSIAEEPTRNNEFFLDTAHVSVSSMPTYLLALDVEAKQTDECNHEDHPAIGDHYQVINYLQGRYMIDAAKSEIVPDYLKDKVKPFENVYSRYAFVNAIHYKDTLYIMNSADATIQYDRDLYNHKNVDTALVLKPKAYEGASIAFRLHDQSDDENFYIETSGEQYGYAADGNTWLKEQNQNIVSTGRGVYSETGDHNYDWNSWRQSVYEDIYQALLLNTTAQSGSTANEDIEVSAVKVIAGNGQITINGAAGKKVVVSNILGQVVANTVLTSDNATIAAPQGVVVVAVEGEEAVKAIVK